MLMLYFKWQFFYSYVSFLKAFFEFLKFGLNIFSVPLLLRTFFWPWHRYWSSYPKGFDPIKSFNALFANLMSRVIGVVLRTFFILIGLLFEVFVFALGLALFALWIALPFIALYLLFLGFIFYF